MIFNVELSDQVETGLAATLFVVVFLAGGKIHPFKSLVRDRRSIISFGSGIAISYVFLQVIPDLHRARSIVAAAHSLRYEGMGIYLLALLGFLLFYGLDHLRAKANIADEQYRSDIAFQLHLGGFAVYVWLMSYLLINSLESISLYATAIGFHFLAMDHSLREEHGETYDRTGRFVLAAMCGLGWGVAQFFAMPQWVSALLLAFISGAIIMNSTITELPTEKDGRFLPFFVGGVLYAVILLPLG